MIDQQLPSEPICKKKSKMKKYLVLIAIILLTPMNCFSGDFKKTNWGMSIAEVKEVEEGELVRSFDSSDYSDPLTFPVFVGEIKAWGTYKVFAKIQYNFNII